MAPTTPATTSKTKPLKPYRRGETLGKASRQGKAPKPAGTHSQPGARLCAPPTSATPLYVDDEPSSSLDIKDSGEVDEVPKRRKKGKKFMDSPESMLALISSITAEKDSAKKVKLKKVSETAHQKAAPNAAFVAEQKQIKENQKKQRLDAAKAAISAKARAAKIEKGAPPQKKSIEAVASSEPSRKQVAFA